MQTSVAAPAYPPPVARDAPIGPGQHPWSPIEKLKGKSLEPSNGSFQKPASNGLWTHSFSAPYQQINRYGGIVGGLGMLARVLCLLNSCHRLTTSHGIVSCKLL